MPGGGSTPGRGLDPVRFTATVYEMSRDRARVAYNPPPKPGWASASSRRPSRVSSVPSLSAVRAVLRVLAEAQPGKLRLNPPEARLGLRVLAEAQPGKLRPFISPQCALSSASPRRPSRVRSPRNLPGRRFPWAFVYGLMERIRHVHVTSRKPPRAGRLRALAPSDSSQTLRYTPTTTPMTRNATPSSAPTQMGSSASLAGCSRTPPRSGK